MPTLPWLDATFVSQLFANDVCQTIAQARDRVCATYPEHNEFTTRTLQRFMQEHDIKIVNRLSQEALEGEVRMATEEIGGTPGRKTMQGFLRSKGVVASQRRITAAQGAVAGSYLENRRQGVQRQLNPQAYHAPHFGFNMHMDQNEKCVDYGVVFVIAVDGMSAFVCRGAVMPRKNNITIYDKVYFSAVEQYGMWEQIIADCGREFFLCEFVQEYMKDFRIKPDGSISHRQSYKQLTSCKNNRVERLWQEVNAQVGMPIKYAFIEMENQHTLDRHNLTHLYATSVVGCSVAKVLLQRWMDAWNHKTIPGKGIPSQYVEHRGNYQLPAGVLPSAADAVEIYRGSNGHLTDESAFGQDPLQGDLEKQNQRTQIFWDEIDVSVGGLNQLANFTVNHNYQPIQQAVTRYIEIGILLSSAT